MLPYIAQVTKDRGFSFSQEEIGIPDSLEFKPLAAKFGPTESYTSANSKELRYSSPRKYTSLKVKRVVHPVNLNRDHRESLILNQIITSKYPYDDDGEIGLEYGKDGTDYSDIDEGGKLHLREIKINMNSRRGTGNFDGCSLSPEFRGGSMNFSPDLGLGTTVGNGQGQKKNVIQSNFSAARKLDQSKKVDNFLGLDEQNLQAHIDEFSLEAIVKNKDIAHEYLNRDAKFTIGSSGNLKVLVDCDPKPK